MIHWFSEKGLAALGQRWDRSHGLGRALLAELHQRARAADCHLLDLDSATHRADAHRFYMRERMSIGAFHFIAQL